MTEMKDVEALIGAFLRLRRQLYGMGMDVDIFIIPDPRDFRELWNTVARHRESSDGPIAEPKVVIDRGSREVYEEFDFHGVLIRCLLPGYEEERRRRGDLDRMRRESSAKSLLNLPTPSWISGDETPFKIGGKIKS